MTTSSLWRKNEKKQRHVYISKFFIFFFGHLVTVFQYYTAVNEYEMITRSEYVKI
jgi:hypothetical protein